ncbi:MAG: DUF4384 domain-containing protein [Gemmatimonadetes bacterium]|nr:DUF4384 domain-containing protein [Gemmatimonadota bacterium]
MRLVASALACTLLLAGFREGPSAAGPARASRARQTSELTARVWLQDGNEPVLRRGAQMRAYYRVSEDAYVAIFHVDTNGFARLLYPRSPGEDNLVLRGRTYRLFVGDSPFWNVDDDPGVGYLFIVASAAPLDFSGVYYSEYDRVWDLGTEYSRIYGDPYAAMHDYVAFLLPTWERHGYALDFTAYHVERTYAYPRFLCYDCHGFRPYAVWNPYTYACVRFRVVIQDDPYYYPVTRYRGSQVVYARPPDPERRRFVFKERASGEPGTPLVESRSAMPEVRAASPERRATDPSVIVPDRGGVAPPAPAVRLDAGPDRKERPTLERRVPAPNLTPASPSPAQSRPDATRPGAPRRSEPAAQTPQRGRETSPPAARSAPLTESRPSRPPPVPSSSQPARRRPPGR